MRPALAIMLAVLTSATFLPFGQQRAVASCAGPYLTGAGDLVLHRGTSVTIGGAAFADGCQDTGACSATPGCSGCDNGPEPTPMSDITLSLRQNGRTWPLDTADALVTHDDVGAVTWNVEIPADLKQGWATLVPEYGQPATVRVR